MASLNKSELYAIYQQVDIDTWFGFSFGSSLLGAIANIYTIVTFNLFKEFQKANYQLILCVAVTDVICDAIFIPIEVLQSFFLIKFKTFLGDDNFCIWEGGFYAIFFSGSVIGQFMIAVNRFIAVYLPNFYRTRMTKKLAISGWFIASIVFPTVYYYAGLTTWVELPIDRFVGDCMEKDNSQNKTVRITLTIYFPLAASILIYILIMLKIVITTPGERTEVIKRARGSAAMFGSMLFYGMCVLPLWISFDSSSYGDQLERTLWIKFFFRLSYAINPLFYVALDKRIRDGYLKLFRRIFKLSQVAPGRSGSSVVTTV